MSRVSKNQPLVGAFGKERAQLDKRAYRVEGSRLHVSVASTARAPGKLFEVDSLRYAARALTFLRTGGLSITTRVVVLQEGCAGGCRP